MKTAAVKSFRNIALILPVALAAEPGLARADQVRLSAELATPSVLAGQRHTAYLKIGLTGFEDARSTGRAPANLAIVLDRSSSMSGEKLEKAKEAALMVLDRLDDRDIVSIITYDSSVEVLVPATKVADRASIAQRIRALDARGMTALFAGVAKGSQELRKFADKNRVSRIILLSDGQANVGPSSPNELGELGHALAKEGVSVTTIGLGLGYNEDLMAQLARRSDGNHAFAEQAVELAKIFDSELGDVLSVIAQEVTVKVRFTGGARPIRSLNRDAEIRGETAILSLNQLYARQEKHFLLEVEIPEGNAGALKDVAEVSLSYANLITKETDRATSKVAVQYTKALADVERATKRDVMVAVVEAVANEKNRLAVTLRDEGKLEEAQKVLLENSAYLKDNANRLNAPKLKEFGDTNEDNAKNVYGPSWIGTRKSMRKTQHSVDSQQSY
jgi:Ca-activated chloride channel homolog